MPLPLPNLDDRTYADLLDEVRALIPSECPQWTDHNPSDTGIVLLELYAWLTETLLYQADRLPEQHYDCFLELLNGSNWSRSEGEDLNTAIQRTVLDLRHRYRAVTPDDFQRLIAVDWPHSPEAQALSVTPANAESHLTDPQIARSGCFLQRNLAAPTLADRQRFEPSHVSLVILPSHPTDSHPVPTPALRRALWNFLDERRLLTIRHHVVAPSYVPIRLRATLYLSNGANVVSTQQAAVQRLRDFFHPLHGGRDGQGWPFGRAVYRSDIYPILDPLPGVDYVTDVVLEGNPTLEAVKIEDYQLVQIIVTANDITLWEAWQRDE